MDVLGSFVNSAAPEVNFELGLATGIVPLILGVYHQGNMPMKYTYVGV